MTEGVPTAVLTSHPVQYQAPFFRYLAARPELDLTVLYSSTTSTDPAVSQNPAFGQVVVWDTDLLSGYRGKVLANPVRARPERRLSLVSPGVVREVATGGYAALVVFG
jgi:hypothetical protein